MTYLTCEYTKVIAIGKFRKWYRRHNIWGILEFSTTRCVDKLGEDLAITTTLSIDDVYLNGVKYVKEQK